MNLDQSEIKFKNQLRGGVRWGECCLRAIDISLEYLRRCALCGNIWGRSDLFCENCWRELFKKKNQKVQTLAPRHVNHFYLFNWGNNEPKIKKMVYLLKGGGLKSAYRRLAWWLTHGVLSSIDVSKGIVFVPAPARHPLSRDHAYMLAEALSEIWSSPLWLAFDRPSGGHRQKTKNSIDRQHIKLTLHKKSHLSSEGRRYQNHVIFFVDDIVTTGATAKAAHEALENIANFHVISIFFRPKLPI